MSGDEGVTVFLSAINSCSYLNETCLYRLMYLNAYSHVDGDIWESLCNHQEVEPCWLKYITGKNFESLSPSPATLCYMFVAEDAVTQLPNMAICCYPTLPFWILYPEL